MNAHARLTPDRIASIQFRLLTSAERVEKLSEDKDLPSTSRLAYRDLAGQCRAQADSLAVLQ